MLRVRKVYLADNQSNTISARSIDVFF